MVNRRVKEPGRVVLDVGGYRKWRRESLGKLAGRLGERAINEGKAVTVGPSMLRSEGSFIWLCSRIP